jgi:PAS domain S-box-containing protein
MRQEKIQTAAPPPGNERREKYFDLLRETETASYWLTALVDSAEDAIISKTLDGVITGWNKGAEQIFGYTADEIIGKPVLILIPPNLQTEEPEILAKISRGERIEHYETVRVAKNGSLVEISLTVSPIKTPEGKIIGASKIARDITKFKQAERRLRESENQLRLITNTLPVLISYIDREQRYRFINSRYTEWFGRSAEQVVGKSIREVIGEAAYASVSERIERVLSGEEIEFEQLMPYPNGDKFIHVNYIPDFDVETKKVKGFCALVRDVSESKSAEARLRESEARLRLAINISQISTFEIDLLTDAVETDETGREIYGWKASEPLVFAQVQTHFHPEDRDRVMQAVAAALAPDGSGEFEVDQRIIRTDGEVRWIRVRGRAFFEGEAAHKRAVRLLGTYIDITSRKREELDRQFLLELGEKIRFGDFKPEKLLDEVTETTCQHLSAGRCLFIEINESENRGSIRHEYFKPGMKAVAEEYQISDYSPQTLAEIKSGRIIVNADAVRDARTADIYQTVYEPYGERAYVSIPLFTDGRWTAIFWISDDKPRRWTEQEIAFLETVGERTWLAVEKLRAEREREDLLRRERAARLQAEEASRLKDEFLATVSHELRTPLNAILGWSQMLASNKFDQNETERAIATIYRNARSQAQLIEDILDVSRIITGKLRLDARPIALAPVVQTAVETLRPAIEAKNIRLQMRLDFEPRMVVADPDRLQQVVWNLLSNAIKFTPERGQVTIKLESGEAETKIIVTDTGKGISREFLPFVFERFRQADGSSTRSHGGLGLGLAIVRHIVELHGGTVEADSAGDGSGATFTVSLPLSETSPKRSDEILTTAKSPTAETQTSFNKSQIENLRILLVDDEPDTLELLASFLTQNGAQTKAVTNVAAALEAIKHWRPDVIVSDIAMPEEDGYSLIKKLRALPEEEGGATAVIALTAYVGIKERTQVLSNGFQMYVPKPVEPSELLGALANFARESK